MDAGEALLDVVDQLFQFFHKRRNVFWDTAVNPDGSRMHLIPEQLPVMEKWDDVIEEPDTGSPLDIRCRKCGMPKGTGCRAGNGAPCGFHKERREDHADSLRIVG
jgi:hypothetical protein